MKSLHCKLHCKLQGPSSGQAGGEEEALPGLSGISTNFQLSEIFSEFWQLSGIFH